MRGATLRFIAALRHGASLRRGRNALRRLLNSVQQHGVPPGRSDGLQVR